MNYTKLFLCVEAMVWIVAGVKVNVQGSLSLGREVVESLSHYLGKNLINARRSLNLPSIEDPITLAVKTAQTCKNVELCNEELQHFFDEYVIILAKAVESILSSLQPNIKNETYEKQLKNILEHIKTILEDGTAKLDKENEVYYWTHVVKRINAKFQNMLELCMLVIKFDTDDRRFNNKTREGAEMDRRHKIIIATAFIERKYIIKMCSEYNLCTKTHECTAALNKLLIHFKTLPEDRIRLFVKYFYKALFDFPFYNNLSPETTHELQVILNDMSYTNDTPTKDIMLSVLKTVEARMEMLQSNKGQVVAHEILLAHTILSDIDHMYSSRIGAFNIFFNKFYDWLVSDVQLEKYIRAVLSDIAKQIFSFEEELVRKLMDEVKVFLEMTVTAIEK